MLRLGAVPQSRGAICAINEIGRMNYEDQAFLLDAMEEGEFSVDKYGIHVTIKSPSTIVATANPTGTKWNDPVKISNVEIPVIKSLLDRFDQIYAFNESSSPQEDREYAQRKAEMDSKNIRYNHQYLKTYLAYPITITPEAKSMLIDFWLEVKAKGLASTRTLDSIFRMTKAHARLHLVEVVDADIATEFMNYYKHTMLQYGEIVKTIESPRDVSYREMLTIVKQAQAPIELITAAKMACDRNEQVRSYLGNNRLDLKCSVEQLEYERIFE